MNVLKTIATHTIADGFDLDMDLENSKDSWIIYFKGAFHGRTGYSLSITDARSSVITQFFPLFDWPCILTPNLVYPLTKENLAKAKSAEKMALGQI